MRWIAAFFCHMAVLSGVYASPLWAQENPAQMTEAEERSPIEMRAVQVVAMINGEVEPEAVLSKAFLKAIPPDQIKQFAQRLVTQYGPALSVERLDPNTGTRSAYEVRFERGIAKGGLATDPSEENRVSELVFRSVEPIASDGDTIQKIKAELDALPGTVSAYFGPLDDNMPALSLNADTPLGLGSTFKFYVLAALGKQVADGERSWDDIVPLSVKSFPSGMMQDYPPGSPHSLHTYASMMISISDNTATDQLIEVLGRDVVYQTMVASAHSTPELSRPFITTRELFLLKGGDKERLEAYADGNLDERTDILASLEDDAPTQEQIFAAFSGPPIRIDVEWLSSANDLLNLFDYMRLTSDPEVFNIMGINKGVGDEYLKAWEYVGHKGGSEPGVRNLTWLLTDANGVDHVLTLGWNNPNAGISTQTLMGFAQRILMLAR